MSGRLPRLIRAWGGAIGCWLLAMAVSPVSVDKCFLVLDRAYCVEVGVGGTPAHKLNELISSQRLRLQRLG